MKVRVKALKRGTEVSPATGHQVHFDPNAKRYPLARNPFVDVRDVDHFVKEGFAEKPKANATTYGLEQEREVIRKEGRAPEDGEQAAKRVANAAKADAAGGTANSGLDTRQTRNYQAGTGPGQDVELREGEDDGEGEQDEGEGEDGLAADDPDAPPPAAKPAPKPAAKPAAAKS